MMAPISEEGNNFVRLVLLLGLTSSAVRTLFDKEFPPNKLCSMLKKAMTVLNSLKGRKILNQAQWDLLFPNQGVPKSATFDVTLMICLFRNLRPAICPVNVLGKLPTQFETTPGHDLARIKWYRNKYAHHGSSTINNADFNEAWGHITDAVGRLGGPIIKQECQDLKVKIVDQPRPEIMQYVASHEELLRNSIDFFGSRHLELTKILEEFTRFKQQSIDETFKRTQRTQYHGTSKNCFLRTLISAILIVGCLCGALVWIMYNKYFLDSKDPPTTVIIDSPSSLDKCDNDITTATIGEKMCIPFTQKFTGKPSRVNVRQKSSQYCNIIELKSFSVNVSSDNFVQHIGDWIINFNSSRTDQQFRFVKQKATCESIGIYEMTIYYGVDNITSFKFVIRLNEPKLQLNVARIREIIHVHCEMTISCIASSLALFVNHEDQSNDVPDTNVCNNNNVTSDTKVSVDKKIHISKFSESQTISCVPLMDNIELAANLTSTTRIPFCKGGECVPGCREDAQSIAYYSHIYFCNRFYQCSNGEMVSHTCPKSTYWSPTICNCVHFDSAICDQKTKIYSKPSMSIEKCSP